MCDPRPSYLDPDAEVSVNLIPIVFERNVGKKFSETLHDRVWPAPGGLERYCYMAEIDAAGIDVDVPGILISSPVVERPSEPTPMPQMLQHSSPPPG